MDFLLAYNLDIATGPDQTFTRAFEDGCQDVVNKFLGREDLTSYLTTSVNILKVIAIIEKGEKGKKKASNSNTTGVLFEA